MHPAVETFLDTDYTWSASELSAMPLDTALILLAMREQYRAERGR